MMQNLVKIQQRIFNRESINPDVLNTINTMFENNAIEYDVETNTLTVNVDIVFKFKENIQIDCDKHIRVEFPLKMQVAPRMQKDRSRIRQ